MNHLEQLVTEWLMYRGYFVRTSALVGHRKRGGHEGELDVGAFNPRTRHFVHVECSLDAYSDAKRQPRFAKKFQNGRRWAASLFEGFELPEVPEPIVILQVAGANVRTIGGTPNNCTGVRERDFGGSRRDVAFARSGVVQLPSSAHFATRR
jgi:hypothetical protein